VNKQKLLDEMDAQLSAMNVSVDERAEIKRSYIRFIGFDFYQLYVSTIDYALSRRMEALLEKNQENPSEENRVSAQTFNVKMSEWRSGRNRSPLEDMPVDEYRKFLHENTPKDTFSIQETALLERLADQIADLFEASRRKGGYTLEAAQFYDKYNDGLGAGLYKLVFNVQ
jgi:hypothetical protein